MSEWLLEAENLVKYFPVNGGLLGLEVGKVHAVDDVSLRVAKGQTLGVVGESGCGKSTLGRTLLRLYEPTSGSIRYCGKDITKMLPAELRAMRRELQMIFQDPYSSLNPRWTVGEILAEPFVIHKAYETKSELKDKVSDLLAEVGLHRDAANRYPHEFSGGQRQRLGIARAVALKPQLIVADEPVSALDVSIQSQILNLMVDLRNKYGLSYVFIAHDLAVIEHISDVVAVMYLGKVVERAPAAAIYENPTHPYTRALIASIPKPEYVEGKRDRPVLDGDVPSPISPPSGCRFHTRCKYVEDICKREVPSLVRHGGEGENEHLVACHVFAGR